MPARSDPGDVEDAATLTAAIKILRLRAGSHDRLASDINDRYGTRLNRQTIIAWERGTFPTSYLGALRELGVPERLLVDPRATAKANRDRLAALEARVAELEAIEEAGREAVGSVLDRLDRVEAALRARPATARPSRARRVEGQG